MNRLALVLILFLGAAYAGSLAWFAGHSRDFIVANRLARIATHPFAPGRLTLDFSSKGNGRAVLITGWHQPESWGLQSEGPVASVGLAYGERPGRMRIALVASGFPPASGGAQHVGVAVQGETVAELALTRNAERHEIEVPVRLLVPDPFYRIDFLIREPTRPADVGHSGVAHARLGIGLREMVVETR